MLKYCTAQRASDLVCIMCENTVLQIMMLDEKGKVKDWCCMIGVFGDSEDQYYAKR
jgi:hypothetical protein